MNTNLSNEDELTNYTFGIIGELGEMIDAIKKNRWHGHDVAKIKEETGDALWYITAICTKYGWKLSEVMAENNIKLRARYPGGFSETDSQNRIK